MLSSLVEWLHSTKNLTALLAAVAAIATVLTLAMPMLQTDKLGNRMKAVAVEPPAGSVPLQVSVIDAGTVVVVVDVVEGVVELPPQAAVRSNKRTLGRVAAFIKPRSESQEQTGRHPDMGLYAGSLVG